MSLSLEMKERNYLILQYKMFNNNQNRKNMIMDNKESSNNKLKVIYQKIGLIC